jgi:general secretion pathway protein E
MAQRLIRRLDDNTKQSYAPSEGEWAKINEVIGSLPEGMERPNLEGLQLYKPGSSSENPYGYQGQLAIREQFTMDSALRELLENPKSNVSTQTIEEAASRSGMRTMLQDGMLKVISGETTLDELYRVVG